MKRTSMTVLISGAIFLAIFNILFFVLGEMPHPASVWISYAFIHFSLILSLVIPLFTSGNKDFARQSTVSFGVTGIYFAFSFVTGLIYIFSAPETSGATKASWILQVIWLALFIIAFLPILSANQHTNQEVARQNREAKFLQDAASKVKFLRDGVTDASTMQQLDLLYTTLASSPIKSNEAVQHLEIQMISQLTELETAVDKKDYERVKEVATQISRGVQERNRILSLASHG
ncbi:MAG: hypothetical protein IKC31_04450 [Clostridia bacterium]|nr:hypothetical protein [Clostridia bacterium]